MSNQISQPMTTNYLLQAFITEIINNRSEVSNGITPNTRIIQVCKNSDYNDFVANGYKYMFLFDETLEKWINNTDDGNKQGRIITHDQIEYNYYTPLITGNTILTPGAILTNSNLFTKRSIQNTVNGPTLEEYITSFLGAYSEIKSQCPHNMANVGYFQPRFYLAEYSILSVSSNRDSETGTFTPSVKTSIIGVMKYKDSKTNVDRVLWLGTGLQQIIPNA